MDWVQTSHNRYFMCFMQKARAAMPEMANDDWFACKGNRTLLVSTLATRANVTSDIAEGRVRALEASVNNVQSAAAGA